VYWLAVSFSSVIFLVSVLLLLDYSSLVPLEIIVSFGSPEDLVPPDLVILDSPKDRVDLDFPKDTGESGFEWLAVAAATAPLLAVIVSAMGTLRASASAGARSAAMHASWS
jgi:hypothetical protein